MKYFVLGATYVVRLDAGERIVAGMIPYEQVMISNLNNGDRSSRRM